MVELYRRNGSKNWYFDITLDDKRYRKSTRTSNRSNALRFAERELRKLLEKSPDDMPTLTLREALYEHYLPSRLGRASYAELERYCAYLVGDHPAVKGLGGNVPFHQLTNAMLRNYRAERKRQGRADRSINLEMRVLSGAYHLLEGEYQVAQGLRFPIRTPKPKPRFLLPDEEIALLDALDPSKPLYTRGGGMRVPPAHSKLYRQRRDNYHLAVLMLDTGCRLGELERLPWSLVDCSTFGWLHIYREKVSNEGRLVATRRVSAVLQERWLVRGGSPWVFPKLDKNIKQTKRSTIAIRRAMETVGINSPEKVERFGRRDVRSLRDTYATKLRQRGMSLDRLQELLGHASPQMTAKYAYLSVSEASQEAAVLLNNETD